MADANDEWTTVTSKKQKKRKKRTPKKVPLTTRWQHWALLSFEDKCGSAYPTVHYGLDFEYEGYHECGEFYQAIREGWMPMQPDDRLPKSMQLLGVALDNKYGDVLSLCRPILE